MVRIDEKKLIQLSNTLVVTLPNKEFLEVFGLKKGDVVKMIIFNKAVMIVAQNTNFNSDEIKYELNLAQKLWDEKEKQEQFEWIKRLDKKVQTEIQTSFEATERLVEEYEQKTGKVWNLASPHWDQPQGANLSKKELLLQHLAEQRKLLKARKEIREITSTDPNQKSKGKQKFK